MKIAIIGSGNIGGGLARAWRRKQHDVTFGAHNLSDPELLALCEEIGAKAVSVREAIGGAEIVALAMPAKAIDEVIDAADFSGRVVIDCTNTLAPGMQLAYGHTTSAAEELAKKIPKAHVFKSFNAQGAENLANPVYDGVRATNWFCGDGQDGRDQVRQLVEDVGFEAVDAGGLAAARLLEPLMLLWVASSRAAGTRDIAFKLLRRS